MDNEKFKEMWGFLGSILASRQNGMLLTELSHAGKIGFARSIQEDLDAWCDEVVARAKGEHENAVASYEALRDEVGESFDKIEAERICGLHFGPSR